MLERVRQQCLGVEDGGGGLVLVTSFGIEPPRTLPQCVKVIGRGHLPETVEALEAHPELKVTQGEGEGGATWLAFYYRVALGDHRRCALSTRSAAGSSCVAKLRAWAFLGNSDATTVVWFLVHPRTVPAF